jgi:hypothetical protein
MKSSFGPWMMRALKLLARFKGLRGTALDPFGYTAERRTERRLIADYRGAAGRDPWRPCGSADEAAREQTALLAR